MTYFFIDLYSKIIPFLSDDVAFNTIELTNISLDDDKFDEDCPETVIHVRPMPWRNKYKQRMAFKRR